MYLEEGLPTPVKHTTDTYHTHVQYPQIRLNMEQRALPSETDAVMNGKIDECCAPTALSHFVPLLQSIGHEKINGCGLN